MNMNKVSLLKILITIAVLLVSGTVTGLCAQTGSTLRFDDVEGDRVLTAADVKYKHFVTCSHTYDDRSCFVVEDFETGQKKKFYTTPHVEPSMFYTCSGYIVNEMTVDVGRNCWFCGTKWERTGQYVYSLEGLLVPETLYYGYVGRFNLNDVMLGSGNFDIMIVDSSYNLEHFALTRNGGIIATEEFFVYEMTHAPGGGYNVTRGKITHPDNGGRFMGVVCTGDTVVTLARCMNQTHYFHFHEMFYLGYGQTDNFVASNSVYCFNVYEAYNDRRARMETDAPIHLTATNKGSGVIVSYITENTDLPYYAFPGKMILFHFPYINVPHPEIVHTMDTGFYAKLKDVKSSDSIRGNSFLAALLEDNYGNSVWRFPILESYSAVIYDTVRKVQNPRLESIIPFRNPDYNQRPSFCVSGYYPLYQNKVARNITYNHRNETPQRDLTQIICYTTSPGYWWVEYSLLGMWQEQNFTIGYRSLYTSSFEQVPFVSEGVITTLMCGFHIIPIQDCEDE